jgi:hypothetical protein
MHGRNENAYKIYVRQPQGKKQLEGLTHKWKDNIKEDHKKWDGIR